MFVRLAVVDEFFFGRIPVELTAGLQGYVSQNRGRGRALANLNVGVECRLAAHGFNEVSDMGCFLILAAAANRRGVIGKDPLVCSTLADLPCEQFILAAIGVERRVGAIKLEAAA